MYCFDNCKMPIAFKFFIVTLVGIVLISCSLTNPPSGSSTRFTPKTELNRGTKLMPMPCTSGALPHIPYSVNEKTDVPKMEGIIDETLTIIQGKHRDFAVNALKRVVLLVSVIARDANPEDVVLQIISEERDEPLLVKSAKWRRKSEAACHLRLEMPPNSHWSVRVLNQANTPISVRVYMATVDFPPN